MVCPWAELQNLAFVFGGSSFVGLASSIAIAMMFQLVYIDRFIMAEIVVNIFLIAASMLLYNDATERRKNYLELWLILVGFSTFLKVLCLSVVFIAWPFADVSTSMTIPAISILAISITWNSFWMSAAFNIISDLNTAHTEDQCLRKGRGNIA